MTIKIETTKAIAKLVVSRAVSGVIVTTLHNNCPVETKSQKVQLYIGAYLVGSMVADAAVEHVNDKIDSIAKAWNDHKANKTADK